MHTHALKQNWLNYSSPNEYLSAIFYRYSFENNTNFSANLQANNSHTFREHVYQSNELKVSDGRIPRSYEANKLGRRRAERLFSLGQSAV